MFRDRFVSSFGRTPRVLEAYGYDVTMMLQEVVSRHGKNRVKDALQNHQGYDGVTGIRGFQTGGGAVLDTKVLVISDTGVGE